MYKDLSKLIVYKPDLSDESGLLTELAWIFKGLDEGEDFSALEAVNSKINRILHISTEYGFDKNLWQSYLTFVLIMHENPFSLLCEKTGIGEGSIKEFILNDYEVFIKLFNYDFSKIEERLGTKSFSVISDYKAVEKKENIYNKYVSQAVADLREKLASTEDPKVFYGIMTDFYREKGLGQMGLNRAFRVDENSDLLPINNMEWVKLDDLVGYDLQKEKIVENTEAFIKGARANNALLYGDRGTGKSTTVKAVVNSYFDRGLRMIEIGRYQFKTIPEVIAKIKTRNYKFIIFLDDLSFEDFETEYKFLKAVIEGGVETKPDNVLIYATSNRRHIVRESWADRTDMAVINDVHKSDTMDEKISMADRFGCKIYFPRPSKTEYHTIVSELAKRNDIGLDEEDLYKEANKWEMMSGNLSGRTAQQFINYLQSKEY